MNSNVIITINMHLSDCFEIEESQRTQKCEQMIEFIVYLYRNLLKIPDITSKDSSLAYKRDLQPKFIATLSKHNTLDAFIYIVQQSSNALMKKIGIILLEVFYHIFSPFEPVWLFKNSEQDKTFLTSIREKETRERMIRLSERSSRHARFDCNIKIVRNFGAGSKVIHNPFKNDWDQNIVPNASKKPKARKFDPKNTSIFPNNHDKEIIVSDILMQEEFNGSLKQVIRNYAVDFVDHVYSTLVERLYEEIHKESRIIFDHDRIYFFILMGFGLEVFRYNLQFKKANRDASVQSTDAVNDDDYSIASISAALQIPIFDHIQATILKQVNVEKISSFNIRIFHAAFHSYLQLLYCIKEARFSTSEATRRNIHILTQKIFSKDNSNMVRKGFCYYKPEIHDPKVGRTLAEFVGIFFDLMDEYSRGKVIKIQTGRLIRRNREKEREREMERKRKEKEKRQKQKKKEKEERKKEKEKRKKERQRKRRERLREKEKKEKRRARKLREASKKIKKSQRSKTIDGEERTLEDQENKESEQQEGYMDEEPNTNLQRENAKIHNQDKPIENSGKTLETNPSTLITIGETQLTRFTDRSGESDSVPALTNGAAAPQVNPTLEVPTLEVSTFDPEATLEISQTPMLATLEVNTLEPEIEHNEPTQQFVTTIRISTPNDDDENNENMTLAEKRTDCDQEVEINKGPLEKAQNEIAEKQSEEKAHESTDDKEPDEEDEQEEEDDDKMENELSDNGSIDNNDADDDEQIDTESEDEDESESEDEDGDENEGPRNEEEEDEEGEGEFDSEDDTPQYKETVVSFKSELSVLADYRVMNILLNMIRVDRLEKNDPKVNNSITGFIKRAVHILKAEWLFFQIDFLLIFQDILNTKNQKVAISFFS